jgi:PAS domain S-box-containing protein
MPSPRVAPFEPALLWQKSADPLFWLDPSCRLIWVNQAWEELTGYAAELVLGLTCQAHSVDREPGARDLVSSFFPPPEALAGRPTRAPSSIVRPDGERLWREVAFWPFRDKLGGLLGILGAMGTTSEPPDLPASEAPRHGLNLQALRSRQQAGYGIDSLIGLGPLHRRLLTQVRLAADSSVATLIVGEPGTGKRHVARTIHRQGSSRQHPLLAFDCAALSPEILERDLFEHLPPLAHANSPETLAPKPRIPDGSTLLLVEILRLPRDLQMRLVAALGPGVRLIATTSSELEPALESHQFRADLYFALSALVLRLAPLRNRRDDIPLLAQSLLESANKRDGALCRGFTPEAMEVLASYDWPGNLAELARVIEHARANSAKETREPGPGYFVQPANLPTAVRGHIAAAYTPPLSLRPIKPLDELLTEVEQRLIETALRQARGNKSRAAEILGISRPRLYRRIKELGLPDDDAPDES